MGLRTTFPASPYWWTAVWISLALIGGCSHVSANGCCQNHFDIRGDAGSVFSVDGATGICNIPGDLTVGGDLVLTGRSLADELAAVHAENNALRAELNRTRAEFSRYSVDPSQWNGVGDLPEFEASWGLPTFVAANFNSSHSVEPEIFLQSAAGLAYFTMVFNSGTGQWATTIHKVDVTNVSLIKSALVSTWPGDPQAAAMDPDGRFILYVFPGSGIVKLDLATLSVTATLRDSRLLWSVAVDGRAEYAYIGGGGILSRLRLATFSYAGNVSLRHIGTDSAYDVVFDPPRDVLYVWATPYATMVVMKLSNFSVLYTRAFASLDNALFALDAERSTGYFVRYSSFLRFDVPEMKSYVRRTSSMCTAMSGSCAVLSSGLEFICPGASAFAGFSEVRRLRPLSRDCSTPALVGAALQSGMVSADDSYAVFSTNDRTRPVVRLPLL